jgi:hypothetical protein
MARDNAPGKWAPLPTYRPDLCPFSASEDRRAGSLATLPATRGTGEARGGVIVG